MPKKLTQQDFIAKSNNIHNNKYDYTNTVYINSKLKVDICCPIHGIFQQTPSNHFKYGCKKCGDDNITFTTSDFIKKANVIHNNKYNYTHTVYVGSSNNISIMCQTHGLFTQKASSHLKGSGCIKCANDKQSMSVIQFEKLARKKHNNIYNYVLTDFKTTKSTIIVICKKHGNFEQTASSHLTGKGCRNCQIDSMKLTKKEFITKANIIHNDYYNYSRIIYNNTGTKINIICPEHGLFNQTPANHLRGHGCSKCGNTSISKKETKWLNQYNILEENRQYKILKYKVDGYNPLTNTIYEFHGDFWHGNPKIYNANDINPICKITYGELYEKTIERENILKNAGYNLITIWESDFDET